MVKIYLKLRAYLVNKTGGSIKRGVSRIYSAYGFFNREKGHEEPDSSLIFSGGLTTYMEDPKENKSYNTILQFDTHDLKTER
jgi:hypothetical protein